MAVDITINETIDLVDITVNPNIIEVNVTRTSGGGGNQTLAQTLVLGNQTGGENILVNNADAIELENGSSLKKGTYDFGGDGGISRICSVDYEDMWQAGIRHVFDNNGFIRHSTNCFDVVPDSSFDNTLRFKVDSLWTLDYGTTYKCTDASTGAAVWEIYNNFIPTFQQVTDEGATTDNTIYVTDGTNETSIQIGQVQILDGLGSYAQIGAQGAGFVNGDGTGIDQCSVSLAASWGDQITGLSLSTQDGTNVAALEIKLPPEYYTDLPVENITSNYFIPFKPSGDYTLATLDDITGGGTVTSVGLTMPSAFTVTNSPITSSGDIAVTGAGAVSQYVRGDGTLANFPTSSGGGSSLSFYFNGSVSQGTFGGVAFKEMDRTPILGAGTDFTINANGYIQSFITDAGVPNLLEIPAGNWNFETYFSASSGGGSPSFYVELYKWNGTTLSLIASNSATPEVITGGTSIDLYVSSLAVPQTTLLATDRLAVRIYVTHSGRTITLHTEDNNLCQVITTFSTGLTALNGLTAQVQNLATGTSGTDFGIVSSGSTHTFNLPNASAANRGLLTSADWSTFNGKQNDLKTFNRTEGIYYFEEFMGGQGGSVASSFGGVTSNVSGTGAACITTNSILNKTNQQGVVRHTTGTTLSGFAGTGYGSQSLFIGSGKITLETYVAVETLSTATERFFTFFGYAVPSNWQSNANAIFFSYDEGGAVNFASGSASPNFKCYTKLANVTTLTTTSVPVVASQWYKLRIDINNAGNSVSFYIDGTLVATHTTNIPASTTGMSVVNLINKTIGTTARTMQTDYFMYEEIFTTPR